VTPAVSVDRVSHTYAGKTPRQALVEVSFQVQPGEIFGLLGPNGGGKSTLFHILSTYFLPSSGLIQVFGASSVSAPDAVRRNLGVVFQSPGLDKKLSVQENLWHQGHLYGFSGRALTERIQKLLTRLNLMDRRSDRVETLSGGLKRRVEVAKGLLSHPKLLLLDEPSTGLDPVARRELWRYLQELREADGLTVLVTTHFMDEADLCDRVAILDQGHLVALGKPVDLKAEIGGDVIVIESAEPEHLSEGIRKKFNLAAQMVDHTVRIERKDGHEFIPQLVTAFPGLIRSVSLGRPTLEDVFVHKTGHRFEERA
jgi:ABC-2 type transport system ATP-binding protein